MSHSFDWRKTGSRVRRVLGLLCLSLLVFLLTGEVAVWALRHSSLSFFDLFKGGLTRRHFSDPSVLKIVAVGDSFTYGIGSDRQARRLIGYPELLEKFLTRPDGKPAAEVINLGVPASPTGAVRDRLSSFLRRTRTPPDVVLIAAGINNLGHWPFFDCLVEQGLAERTLAKRVRETVADRLFLGKFLLFLGLVYRLDLPPWFSYPAAYQLDDRGQMVWFGGAYRQAADACLRRDYQRLFAICREAGAQPILVTYYHGQFITEVQRQLAAQEGVVLVDLQQLTADCTRAPWQYLKGADWHPDFQGYVATAAFVAQAIAALPAAIERDVRVKPFVDVLAETRVLLKPDAKLREPYPCANVLMPLTSAP